MTVINTTRMWKWTIFN